MQHQALLHIGEELGDLKRRVGHLEESLSEILYWLRRGMILITLWGTGIAGNLNSDQLASIASGVIKLLIDN